MTFDERVQALAPWRFTPRQARFLVTVALHGGYCLRRQYTAFAGVRYGSVVRDFLDGLVARRLASRLAYRADRGFLYHVQARPIYRALQQDNNRNRRRTSAAAIGRKLMLLDVVIGEPAAEWYATEADKVALFTGRFGVPLGDLPQRTYAAYDQRRTPTTRYFIHKRPIGLVGDPARVQFVTLGLDATGQAIDQFLHDHARLLGHLTDWTVVVVRPRGWSGPLPCRAGFDRYITGTPASAAPWDRREVARYFATRRAVDANDFAHLSVTDLNRYRDARRRFADPVVDTLYARWCVDGDRVLDDLEAGTRERSASRGRLIEHTLPFTYEQFGDLAGVC